MKVKELIEKLKTVNPELEVWHCNVLGDYKQIKCNKATRTMELFRPYKDGYWEKEKSLNKLERASYPKKKVFCLGNF